MIELGGLGTFHVVLIMAIITLATRWGGLCLMSFFVVSDAVKTFIDGVAASVLTALLVPIFVGGDYGVKVGFVVAIVVVILSKSTVLSVIAGALAAALFRQLF
jgi:uncharacterized membrane protein